MFYAVAVFYILDGLKSDTFSNVSDIKNFVELNSKKQITKESVIRTCRILEKANLVVIKTEPNKKNSIKLKIKLKK